MNFIRNPSDILSCIQVVVNRKANMSWQNADRNRI
jgi:hypothetical protein